MLAFKYCLDLNRNELAGRPDFDMNLKANPTGMIQSNNQK